MDKEDITKNRRRSLRGSHAPPTVKDPTALRRHSGSMSTSSIPSVSASLSDSPAIASSIPDLRKSESGISIALKNPKYTASTEPPRSAPATPQPTRSTHVSADNLPSLKNSQEKKSNWKRKEITSSLLSAPSKPKQVELSGALTKLGYFRSTWRLRFFVLKGNRFYYYENHLEKEPKGIVLLDKRTVISVDDTKGKPFCFKIVRPNSRTFYLCAKDEAEMNLWLDSLKTSIKQQIHTQIEIQCLVILLSNRTLSQILLAYNNVRNKDQDEIIEVEVQPVQTPQPPPVEEKPIILQRPRTQRLSPRDVEALPIPVAAVSAPRAVIKRSKSEWLNYKKQPASLPNPSALAIMLETNAISPPTESPPAQVVPVVPATPVQPVVAYPSITTDSSHTRELILLMDVSYVMAVELVQYLLQADCDVRIAVRKGNFASLDEYEMLELEQMGADVVLLDFENDRIEDSGAFRGVQKMLLFSDLGNVDNIVQETAAILAAADKNRVGHIVKSSFICTEKWHRYAETLIARSGIPFTLFHTNFFMQSFLVDGIKNTERFCLPLQDSTKVSWVDIRDVCAAFAKVLTSSSDKHIGKIFVLTGPEAKTCSEVAEIISKVTTTSVSFAEVTEEMARKFMQESEIPEWVIDSHTEAWDKLNKDTFNSLVSPDIATIVGTEATSFETFAQDYIDSLREEYLRYFTKDSENLNSLRSQFQRMNRKKKKKTIYDGKVDRESFLQSLALILGDKDLAEALWTAFKTNLLSEKMSFAEYAAGVGKILRGTPEDKWELCCSMYEDAGTVNEKQFYSVCNAVHRFTHSIPLNEEKKATVYRFFFEIVEAKKAVKSTKGYRLAVQQLKKAILANEKFMQIIGLLHAGTDRPESRRSRAASLMISFGHQSWDLAENMLLGIRDAVLNLLEGGVLEISDKEYEVVRDFPIHREHHSLSFVDYAPIVFHNIRRLLGIQPEAYMSSLAPAQLFGALEEVVSTGRSGSFIYRSSDRKYLLKTITLEETTLLRKYLKEYYKHLKHYPNSLLTKYLGLHKMTVGKRDIYFVVMKNVLDTELTIHEQYDLKGSTIGRLVELKEGAEKTADMSLKDLNFTRKISMSKATRKAFLTQVEKDCKWLEDKNICDYSLLLGYSFLNPVEEFPPNKSFSSTSAWTQEYGGLIGRTKNGEPLKEVYFMGLIDILTEYDIKKKSEYAIKSLLYMGSDGEISAQPPTFYKERFVKYLASIVLPEDS